ncbi:hypothetical protein ACQP2F_08620 [Actinoplanes sp. CA-030573]|uniref:hypothetical protein n=1 Tax=Actinoplanes sp. CA-030573 TaxID=3239898 RepID=UPI003D94B92E
MASNLFGPGNSTGRRSAHEIRDAQDAARAADARQRRAAAAAGRDRRSIGGKR